jgi:hypothetical protein
MKENPLPSPLSQNFPEKIRRDSVPEDRKRGKSKHLSKEYMTGLQTPDDFSKKA